MVYPTTSTMAVVSMALALFSPCLCDLGVLTSLTSIILGFVVLRGIKQSAGGNLIVYCHVSEGKCAFLVHVPDYRKYSGDAKETPASVLRAGAPRGRC